MHKTIDQVQEVVVELLLDEQHRQPVPLLHVRVRPSHHQLQLLEVGGKYQVQFKCKYRVQVKVQVKVEVQVPKASTSTGTSTSASASASASTKCKYKYRYKYKYKCRLSYSAEVPNADFLRNSIQRVAAL